MSVRDPHIDMPEIRITRISDNYLQYAANEENEQKPRPPTRAQKKAARKEAKRLQKVEEQKLVMRHALEVELELGKRMEQRGKEEWDEMASQIKIVELRDEMIQWGEQSQRIIDNKNDRIQMLLDDMAQTHRQQSRSFGKTLELIDHIDDCYQAMLEGTKNMYEQQAEDLLKEYYDEVHLRTEEVDAMRQNSENIIHASNLNTRHQLQEDYKIYLEQRDDNVNREIERRFEIRDQVVNKMLEMQRQLNDFVDSLHNTELDAHKYERIRSLTERQQAFFEESKKLDAEESKMINKQNEIQTEMLQVETENNSVINDLRLEFEYFSNVRKKIEERMHSDRTTTHEKLRILSTECYELTKKFEKIVKSGELLLALSITCRKLQTESEKIIVGGEIVEPIDVGEVDEHFTLQTLDIKKHVDISEEDLVNLNKSLKNFWRQQAMAQAQNLLLLEEKRSLTEENQRYIDFIKSMSKTDNAEELRSAMIVQPVIEKVPLLFDTKCRFYKLRNTRESITADKDAKKQAMLTIKALTLDNL
ncbi:kinesin-related protein 4 [Drosophila grimshawi]|uniref:Dynein regulatory complex subunit 2 n=1 Tax=Drosophila grimshawi TaxID=7222 RepID=B4J136_DROGR|nr:kinesin-related protein 4 [Drosophila grimshawi]EDV96891.1 GH16525 [Drosophila grimshawi]